MSKYFYALMLGAAIFTNESLYAMDPPKEEQESSRAPVSQCKACLGGFCLDHDDDEKDTAKDSRVFTVNTLDTTLKDLFKMNRILKLSIEGGDKVRVSLELLNMLGSIFKKEGCSLPVVEGDLAAYLAIESNVKPYLLSLQGVVEKYTENIHKKHDVVSKNETLRLLGDAQNAHAIMEAMLKADISLYYNIYQDKVEVLAQETDVNVKLIDPKTIRTAALAPQPQPAPTGPRALPSTANLRKHPLKVEQPQARRPLPSADNRLRYLPTVESEIIYTELVEESFLQSVATQPQPVVVQPLPARPLPSIAGRRLYPQLVKMAPVIITETEEIVSMQPIQSKTVSQKNVTPSNKWAPVGAPGGLIRR